MTRLSIHFMATDVRALWRSSFSQVTLAFLGTWMMVVCLKHVGITDCQGQIENVIVGTCQLVSACSEYTPFVIRGSLQAVPHLTSVRTGVVGFDLSPVLMISLFDGSSESIVGVRIGVRIRVPLLESGRSSL